MIAAGDVAEVGFGNQVNIELVLELAPPLVMSYGYNPTTDAHPVLLQAGIFTALDASWRELSPLGRAEWIKFTALFYNEEERANAIYTDIVAKYEAVRATAAAVGADDRPTVLINSFLGYADAWFIPGEDTYVGQLDAATPVATCCWRRRARHPAKAWVLKRYTKAGWMRISGWSRLSASIQARTCWRRTADLATSRLSSPARYGITIATKTPTAATTTMNGA